MIKRHPEMTSIKGNKPWPQQLLRFMVKVTLFYAIASNF